MGESGFAGGFRSAEFLEAGEIDAAVAAALACPGHLHAGTVAAGRHHAACRGDMWLAVALRGHDGRHRSAWVLTSAPAGAAPAAGLRRVSHAEAGQLAALWLRLRRRGEVACGPAWSATLPREAAALAGG